MVKCVYSFKFFFVLNYFIFFKDEYDYRGGILFFDSVYDIFIKNCSFIDQKSEGGKILSGDIYGVEIHNIFIKNSLFHKSKAINSIAGKKQILIQKLNFF